MKGILKKIGLKPLTLADKCRLQFGGAVLFSLTLALLVPYFWMGKLAEENTPLSAGRAVVETIFENHFTFAEQRLPRLDESGAAVQEGKKSVLWIKLYGTEKPPLENLGPHLMQRYETIRKDPESYDMAWVDYSSKIPENNYIRIIRAGDSCIRCHHTEGSAGVFNVNQEVGVLVVRTEATGVQKIILMNRLWTIVAGLLAATGAMIAFYWIFQRVILRPIRQLRALVNNIAEGNLDARSAIKSGDEYEKLSNAFNHMLDVIALAQEKLRQANRQLDAKIAELSERNIELYKANKLKSEFLANMSHEFRTPLNAIIGFAQILREKPGENVEKSKRYAENIITSGRSLLNMITDLLTLAKTEAGKMELRIEKTSVTELCRGLAAFFSPLTEQKSLEVVLDLKEDIPIIETDSSKVQQILFNLLSNAVKFTPEGGRIKISAFILNDRMIRISVEDNGPGISEEDSKLIFDKFRQLDGSITRTVEGTGLGLAICKQLAELLAGNIGLESEPGKGSVFSLDIPISIGVGKEEGLGS